MRILRPLPARRAGMVLVLVLIFTATLILFAASMSGSTQSRLLVERDARRSLRAEMASEAGLEHAQRMLALNLDWIGTAGNVELEDGCRFAVSVNGVESVGGGVHDVDVTVTGYAGDAVHRFSSVVRVAPADGVISPYALMVLGVNFLMSDGMVYGDMVLADKARRVNDWMFDADGEGYYAESHGPAQDGLKLMVNSGVDGTVWKYRDDLLDYQWLGEEQVLGSNVYMPSWDLDEYAAAGTGKVHLTNPHNLSGAIWHLEGLTYEETVVITLTNRQTVTLTNCDFKGGLVVLCPEEYDVRSGARNLVHVKKGTTIGGGAGGYGANIGLIAPGGRVKNEGDPNSLTGFSLVNEVDLLRNATVNGQFVILNDCKDLRECVFSYDPDVSEDLPPGFGYGELLQRTEVLSVFEDFEE